jgi:hypothetical protein
MTIGAWLRSWRGGGVLKYVHKRLIDYRHRGMGLEGCDG